ncbi:hypothetical protein EJB05_02537, partial [Eragrostis curvula]
MVERRCCLYARHGFLLLVPLFFFSLFHNESVAAANVPPSLQLDKRQADTMANLLSIVGNSWKNTSNPCNWRGVGCLPSGSGSLVVRNLTLLGQGIPNPSVFASICHLETLQVLDLSKNSIPSLPNQSVPSPCAMSAELKRLNLSSNRLSGPLPNFSVFTKLEILDLSFNKFSGSVSTVLNSLPKLGSLNLSSYNLEGNVTLPPSTPLTLKELVLSGNGFTGQIPKELFFGQIPANLTTLKNLSRFAANQNNFTGPIPNGITKNVRMLDLSYNKLNGIIPSELLSPSRLETVDLTGNQLEGNITGNISPSLYRLRLSNNRISGVIPESIGDALALAYLDLDTNKLAGNIPLQLGNCKNLVFLNLANNALEVGMAIPPAGVGARGFYTRRARARVVVWPRGSHPRPHPRNLGAGLGVTLHPRVARGTPE